jgi:hypothetical protein
MSISGQEQIGLRLKQSPYPKSILKKEAKPQKIQKTVRFAPLNEGLFTKSKQPRTNHWKDLIKRANSPGIDEITDLLIAKLASWEWKDPLGKYKKKPAWEVQISGIFRDLLTEITDNVERNQINPEQAAEAVKSQLWGRIVSKNTETLKLEEEEVAKLVSEKPRLPATINISSPEFKKLEEEYFFEEWEEKEVCTFVNHPIDESTLSELETVIEVFSFANNFMSVLIRYFTQESRNGRNEPSIS